MDFLPKRKSNVATSSATDVAVANAKGTVSQFLIYLRDRPLGIEIRSSDELPAGKGALIDAFRLLIAHELRPEQSGQLRKVGLYLAQFRRREGEDATREEWDQMFAEQGKLEKMFKLSARYSRRDVDIRWVPERAGFGDANRMDG